MVGAQLQMLGPNEHPVVRSLTRRHANSHLLTDGPDETSKLSRDRSNDDRCLLTSRDHRAVARAEPGLCLPGDVADLLRQFDENLRLLLRDARRIEVAPRCFYQHASGFAVAGLGDAASPDRGGATMGSVV